MKVFVVNLERRPDRRQRMEQILPASWAAEYTTHWAGPLDGRTIDLADLDPFSLAPWQIESDNTWWNRPLKRGEIGCAVSHWMCWNRAHETGADTTLILEDDVCLVDDIERRLPEAMRSLDALDRE